MIPKSHTAADQVRELGLSIGDVIIGREEWGHEWSDAELTLLFVGETIAVFSERNKSTINGVAPKKWSRRNEIASWTLEFRDWIKQ